MSPEDAARAGRHPSWVVGWGVGLLSGKVVRVESDAASYYGVAATVHRFEYV